MKRYFNYLLLSTVTWLLTNAIGAAAITAVNMFGLGFTVTFVLSLVLSAPAVFGLVGSCFHLATIDNQRKRLTWALIENVSIVFMICVGFLLLAWRFAEAKYAFRSYPDSLVDYVILLAPFAISAPFCFILIANKVVFPTGFRFVIGIPFRNNFK